MAFLLAAPPFNYSEGVIGLFGGRCRRRTGRASRRRAGRQGQIPPDHLRGAGVTSALWAAIWYGHVSVLALIVGITVLDLTVQGVHITNQTVIYRVKPEARNRLTAGYMTSYFIGGAAGSLISASAWQHAGWSGYVQLAPSSPRLTCLYGGAATIAGGNSLSFTLLWAS